MIRAGVVVEKNTKNVITQISVFLSMFLKLFFRLAFVFPLFILFSFLTPQTFANTNLPVVTVINPIREPGMQFLPAKMLPSIQSQFKVIEDENIPATWLWQYTVLDDQPVMAFAKDHQKNQEYGLFLEIDPHFALDAKVPYRGQGPWYFSDGLLLSSYDVSERQKLIDTAFTKFKKTFGYYPKTVGAWWIGADSLSYMHKKYGVVASLRAADQFNLDVYSIWGTPWSIPYVASLQNAAVPATNLQNSTDVVLLQWAARDPLQGYGPTFEAGTFSMQDFDLKGYDSSYMTYLMDSFLKKPLDNIVVGLEGGFTPQTYSQGYKDHMELLKSLQDSGKISLLFASDYATQFLHNNITVAPTHYFLTKDFKTDDESFWFNSPYGRVGIQKRDKNVFLVDARNYQLAGSEDFLLLPNSQGELRIDTPSLIDSARTPSQRQLLATVSDSLTLKGNKGNTELLAGDKKIAEFSSSGIQVYGLKNGKNVLVMSLLSQEKQHYVDIFWILFDILLFYTGLVLLLTRSLKKTIVHFLVLVGVLFIAKPLLSTGFVKDITFAFDRKAFFLFFVPFISKLSPIYLTIFLFQIFPFLLLLLAHFIFIVRKWTKNHFAWYVLSVGLFAFFYANVFYFPFDRSTYVKVFAVFAAIGLLLFATSAIVGFMTKSVKKFLLSLFFSIVILIAGILIILFSRQEYVLAPFEQTALLRAAVEHKNVLFLYPTGKPIYKAVRPILYDYPKAGEQWTHSHWQKTTGFSDMFLAGKSIIIFVPRYLGASDISEKDMQKYKLVRIFDNGQIVLYKTQ